MYRRTVFTTVLITLTVIETNGYFLSLVDKNMVFYNLLSQNLIIQAFWQGGGSEAAGRDTECLHVGKHKYPRLPVNSKNRLTISLSLSQNGCLNYFANLRPNGQTLDLYINIKHRQRLIQITISSSVAQAYLDVVFTCSIV